jgi:hypothetical protein
MYDDNQLEPNPYAAPTLDPAIPLSQGNVSNAIFQKNGVLIVHKNAQLPDRCIKSNEPTQSRLKRKLYWHHPALYLLILLHILVYIVVALIVRKSAVLWIPLEDRFKQARIRNIFIAWLLFFLGMGSLITGIIVSSSQNPMSGIFFLLCPVLILAGALVGIFGCRVVYPKKIEGDYVWLKGVSPDFLSELPEWPEVV